MAKAQAYQRYGADLIVRATFDVESPNPPYNMEKYVRGAAVRFSNQETKALFFEAYDKWIKDNIK